MTKKFSKTTAKNAGGRYVKRSTKRLFVFFSLILSLSLLTNACRSTSGGDGDPPNGGNGQPPPTMLTPKQVVIDGMTINEGLDSISFGWALNPNSWGEDVVGVVAVLSTETLRATSACANVPEGVLAHARDGSGSGSETSGNPRYMAANDNDGSTVTFGGLTANTTYSLALCSVSADKIRGDGTGGAANQAVVRSVMISEPPPELPPRQVTIGSIVSESGSIRFVWALDAMNITGETVVGVVAVLAVLREATDPLPVDSVCQNVPEAILTYARTGSGTSTQDSGDNMYMADNNSEGNTLTFPELTPGTNYSLAVCSVSAMKIRGDGNQGGNAVVQNVMTDFLPPQQVTIGGIDVGLDSLGFTWALDGTLDMTQNAPVVGVVAVLSTGTLMANSACAGVPAGDPNDTSVPDVIGFARGVSTGSESATVGGVRYIAVNDDDGSDLTFEDLTANTTYSLAVCSVSDNKIRGTAGGGDAAIASEGPMTEMPPQQVEFVDGMTTVTSDSITFDWQTPAGTGQPVLGVVAVLREGTDPLPLASVCETLPPGVLEYARDSESTMGSRTGTLEGNNNMYLADNDADGSTLTFPMLMPATTYSLALCAVSDDNIRGDGNQGGNAVVQNVMTDFLPPQQVTIGGIDVGLDSLGFTWALDGTLDMTQNAPVVGVVAVLSTGTLMANSACASVPAGDPNDTSVPDVIGFARGVSTGSESAMVGGVRYIAVNDDDGSDLTFEDLTANTTYSLAVCSVSDNKIRGTAGGGDAAIASEGPMTEMPPQQVEFVDGMTTVTSDSITFKWQTPAGTGQPVLGVVAVLRDSTATPALTATNACQTFPDMDSDNTGIDIPGHARGSSGTNPRTFTTVDSRTTTTTTYIADNRNGFDTGTMMPVSHTVTFSGLMSNTEYTIALCSVSAEEIRGDGGQGGAAVVQSQRTDSLPPKQVALVGSIMTPADHSISFMWNVPGTIMGDTNTGEILGVVAALSTSTLQVTNACQNVPAGDPDDTSVPDVLGFARGVSTGSESATVGGVTYIAVNDNDGSSITFSGSGLEASTLYNLALCSVSGGKIRGDGNADGDGLDAILLGSATTQLPPKQVETSMLTTSLDTISFDWSEASGSTGDNVQGVVAVLREGTSLLNSGDACQGTLPSVDRMGTMINILAHARGSDSMEPRLTATTGGITYIADNGDGSDDTVTFRGLKTSTTYSLVVCAVSDMKIRGNGTGGTANQALLVEDAVTQPPAKQITVGSVTRLITSISLTWSAPAASSGDDPSRVLGVLGVLREQPTNTPTLQAGNACETLPSSADTGLLSFARRGSATQMNSLDSDGITTRFSASHFSGAPTDAPSGTLTFPGLTSGTTYSFAVCSVSGNSLRGDGTGATGGPDNLALTGRSTTDMYPFPKQVAVPMPMMLSTGSTSITLNWSVPSTITVMREGRSTMISNFGREVVGVVGALSSTALPQDVCAGVPQDVLNYARTGGTNPGTMTMGGVTYRADYDLDDPMVADPSNPTVVRGSGSLTFDMVAGGTYSLAVCSVAYDATRMEGFISGNGTRFTADGVSDTMGDFNRAVLFNNISITPQSPVKQITASAAVPSATTDIDSIDITWSVSSMADSGHEDVVGVVIVARELRETAVGDLPALPALEAGNACANVNSAALNILSHARGTDTDNPTMSMTDSVTGITYTADNRNGFDTVTDMPDSETATIEGLEPAVIQSIVVCAVSMNNIRGDGNTLLVDSMDNNIDNAFLITAGAATTTRPPVSPKQVEFTMVDSEMTPFAKTSTQVTVGWAVPDPEPSGEAVQGVVVAVPLGTSTTLTTRDACKGSTNAVRGFALSGMPPFRSSETRNNVRYMASNSASGNLTLTGLMPGRSYQVFVCSASLGGDGIIRGDDTEGRIDEAIGATVTTPGVVVIYKSESVLNSDTDHALHGGNFTALGRTEEGTNICTIKRNIGSGNQADGAWGLPEDLDGSDFSNHTFYGSTGSSRSGIEGPFNDLDKRLGVVDAEKQEVWVYYVPLLNNNSRQVHSTRGGSRIIQPSQPVTLAQLIALESDGNYTNGDEVERVFALLQNGDSSSNEGVPTSPTSDFEYWSFTGGNGGLATQGVGSSSLAVCDFGLPRITSMHRGAFGKHNGNTDTEPSFVGGEIAARQALCEATTNKTVLCIASQTGGF